MTVTELLNGGKGVRTVTAAAADDRLLEVVVTILEVEGYDGVQLREVARRARTSLSTVYKRFATRDALIVAALQKWMAEHRYAQLRSGPRPPETSLHEALMTVFRTIFEPWEQHPRMLAAYFRARSSPSGPEMLRHGFDIVAPTLLELLAGVDDAFIADFDAIISNVVYGLLGRFANGEIEVTDIVPTLDRTVYWVTAGYEAAPPYSRAMSGESGQPE